MQTQKFPLTPWVIIPINALSILAVLIIFRWGFSFYDEANFYYLPRCIAYIICSLFSCVFLYFIYSSWKEDFIREHTPDKRLSNHLGYAFLFIGALFEGIKAAFISYWIAIPLGWIGYWVVVKALRIFWFLYYL